ncbi:G-patch domain and KOW motifs-containing protein isoform X2 [Cuculus canorus]|uniref:G-patch domain and KOW motifs-containing protein isoform X2 n=1 Tax=Cuculus canorus TaxID=55661 RepID=UPI0023AA9C72|nr:G-patch domain and KOW motifs-containing protein isoform X2 [Cuculus canorus]
MAADGGAEAEMAAEAAAAAPPGPVSFSFSRKAERRKVLRAEQSAENGGDTDFLTAVEGRELLSSRPAPPPPQELVIPLQPPRRRRNPDPPEGHAPSPASHAPPGSVEAQAVQELLEEVRQSQEPGEGEGGPPLAIPLRLQEGDVPPRPQPGPQDYEAVPVAAFGLAMLRGMGWSQGEGIGRTFKQVVKPLEHRLRPRGLGLGADPAPPGAPQNRGGEEAGEIWGLEVGATVRIESGPHRGMEGKVQALLPEAVRAVVLVGAQPLTLSLHSLRPSSRRPEQPPDPPKDKRKLHPENERPPKKQPRGSPPPPRWLRRDLRVRCVHSGFRGGRFYNCKMVVEDLLSADACVCRTDEGHLVEGGANPGARSGAESRPRAAAARGGAGGGARLRRRLPLRGAPRG